MKKDCFLFALLLILLSGCSKTTGTPDPGNNPPPVNNPPGPDDVQVTAISISYGYTNDVINITGKNFGTDKSALLVKFNNIATPILMPNTAIGGNNFSVKVPAKCGTGNITVTKAGKTATGPSFFYIPSPTITTLYGSWNISGDANGSGLNLRFAQPTDFVFDKNNNIYVTDQGHTSASGRGAIVRKISASGSIATFSGGPLNGITSNDNVTWASGLPGGSGGNSNVNGGEARFKQAYGIGISEDPASSAFKLFICDQAFIRIINEYTATGVYAGVIKDSSSGGGIPSTGGQHEAHLLPTNIGIVVVPNLLDYGSPSLFFMDHGPRIAKIASNGSVTTFTDLTGSPAGLLTRMPDGNFFAHAGGGDSKIYKISAAGQLSTWIKSTDSLHNRASGLNEVFADQIDHYGAQCMTGDKDGNLFIATSNSSQEDLVEIFPDKTFIRLRRWARTTATDGFQGNAAAILKMLIRDNGDMYVIDGFCLRKIVFE